jgi:hypothetical protein
VLTSDYETTAWLRFYAPSLRLIAVDQPNRYLDAPVAQFEAGPWLYVADHTRGNDRAVTGNFMQVTQAADLARTHNRAEIARYDLWLLDGLKSSIQGRTP